MNLSLIERSIVLAAFFRGNTLDEETWTSNSDQVVMLSLFYTDDITPEECQSCFATRSCVGGLYDDHGEILPQVESRYQCLIDLLCARPELIEGGGDFEAPAHPTYTACRLTAQGLALIPVIVEQMPRKPQFPNWPDRQTYPIVE